ncbi:MAG: Hsp20/alpha crystallin family protein [Rhodospirillaceae bacterium]|nr:Hsp20/alpha crystallin family protein [Rhodospirillaceae bacterium]
MSTPAKKELPTNKEPETLPASKVGQHPLLGLRQEVDSLFDNFFSNFSLGPFGRDRDLFDPFRKIGAALPHTRGFVPSMDIKETDKEFRVSAELPGMEEGDIELSLTDGQLVIKGEKKEETKSEGEYHQVTERHYGSVYRSLPLPDGVDEDSVEATYDKGVLAVTLKKTKSKKKAVKSVKIKSK